ncbi:MAG TPA: hypothetical protein VHW64_14400 [Nocardioides sp.]|jgi:hypothetical protein|uniref:hypothetical protein n=1 Tax=Nocardioides sp. TaxID=35761 RepID=UPI002E307ABC|nr:hypothetical protein [Nocardioides sp.]HEX3931891.1 hypothetical protein [Nocardioides sp.]
MTSILKRAALAAALTTAAATTVLTSAGSAQAYTVQVEAGSGPTAGTASFQLSPDDYTWWFFDQQIVCSGIAGVVDGHRQQLGLTLGITTDQCINLMNYCIAQRSSSTWAILLPDNHSRCADRPASTGG